MDSELTFRVVFATLYILLCSILVPIRMYYFRKAQPSGEKISRRERLKEAVEREGKLIFALRTISGLLLLPVLILYLLPHEWMSWFTLPLPTWLRWMCVGLGIMSIPFLVWVQHTLGRSYSKELELMEEHKLVTSGPYHWVRHPMHTGFSTFFIATSLVSANWLLMLASVIVILSAYARIGKEEAMMIGQFGDEYRDYMKRTGRLLPRFIREED